METHAPSFQRVLITGGTGFIGRHFVRRLLSYGIPIRLMVRSKSKATALFPEVTDIVEGALEERSQVEQAMKNCNGVVHLGGLYRFGQRYKKELHQTNVLGTKNILHAARVQGIQKLL